MAETERVETFEDFFHAHYERLLRTMYLTTGDQYEAEDLAQDAMSRCTNAGVASKASRIRSGTSTGRR